MLDFDQWKSEFEQETHASFIRATGKKAVMEKSSHTTTAIGVVTLTPLGKMLEL